MSAQLKAVETEQIDETDMALLQVGLVEKRNALELMRQAQEAAIKAQGSEEFLLKYWREKHHIEGRFTVDETGKITRLPTAETGRAK